MPVNGWCVGDGSRSTLIIWPRTLVPSPIWQIDTIHLWDPELCSAWQQCKWVWTPPSDLLHNPGSCWVRPCLPHCQSTFVVRWVECWMADSENLSTMGLNLSDNSCKTWCQRSLHWLRTDCTALLLPGISEWMPTGESRRDHMSGCESAVCDWESAAWGAWTWLAVSQLCAGPRQTRGHSEIKSGEQYGRHGVKLFAFPPDYFCAAVVLNGRIEAAWVRTPVAAPATTS